MVVLRYFNDMSEAETADLLEVSVGTVKNSTHKALARLRSLVDRPAGTSEPARTIRLVDLTEPVAEVAQ